MVNAVRQGELQKRRGALVLDVRGNLQRSRLRAKFIARLDEHGGLLAVVPFRTDCGRASLPARCRDLDRLVDGQALPARPQVGNEEPHPVLAPLDGCVQKVAAPARPRAAMVLRRHHEPHKRVLDEQVPNPALSARPGYQLRRVHDPSRPGLAGQLGQRHQPTARPSALRASQANQPTAGPNAH